MMRSALAAYHRHAAAFPAFSQETAGIAQQGEKGPKLQLVPLAVQVFFLFFFSLSAKISMSGIVVFLFCRSY